MQRRFQTPCLGVVPHLASPTADAIADSLDSALLRQVFALNQESGSAMAAGLAPERNR